MKISWTYLNQLIDLNNINIINVIDKLTLAGLEVENTIYNRKISDTFIEINLTANRRDITGFIHIANEISAIFKRPILVNNKTQGTPEAEKVSLLKEIKNNYSINTLKLYLDELNIVVTNTILDKINLINLKWGQVFKIYQFLLPPNHFFNINHYLKINEQNIIEINKSQLQELDENSLKTVENLRNIVLINNKIFNKFSEYARKDLLQILKIQENQILTENFFIKKKEENLKFNSSIKCSLQTIENTLGPFQKNHSHSNITKKDIIKTLESLNFHIQDNNNNFLIQVPEERRSDIQRDIDIIEEIGRIYGFSYFIDKLPSFKSSVSKSSTSEIKQKIRQILRSHGFHEIVTYSFQKRKSLEQKTIVNPLNQEQTTLRNNLIENLILSKMYNIYQKNNAFEAFEIGNVFLKESESKTYKESIHLCCLIGNELFNQLDWQEKKEPLTWYQAKGQVEEFFEKLNANISWSIESYDDHFTKNINNYIHPTNTIYIRYKEQTLGVLSQLNCRINDAINTNCNIYFFELDITKLLPSIVQKNHLRYTYSNYPNYPKTTRDLSLKINKSISMEKIYAVILTIQKEKDYMIESINIVNEYCNDKENRTICFRINYRSFTKTLTNVEVDTINKAFTKTLSRILVSKT